MAGWLIEERQTLEEDWEQAVSLSPAGSIVGDCWLGFFGDSVPGEDTNLLNLVGFCGNFKGLFGEEIIPPIL